MRYTQLRGWTINRNGHTGLKRNGEKSRRQRSVTLPTFKCLEPSNEPASADALPAHSHADTADHQPGPAPDGAPETDKSQSRMGRAALARG
jgi:hypothetical protein